MAIVLGLHGWDGTHDAAAALVIDGEVVACVEEERVTRRKHALSLRPRLSARAVLQFAGIQLEDVDVVAYGWDLPHYLPRHGASFSFTDDTQVLRAALDLPARKWPRLEWNRHHHAHAAAGFFTSGLSEAAVLVVDGQGEDRSISLFSGDERGLRLIEEWSPRYSLGFLYEAATLHCGFGFLHAGKTMGLAAFGTPPSEPLPIGWRGDELWSAMPDDIEEGAVVTAWRRVLSDRFGRPACPPRSFDHLTSALGWCEQDVQQHEPMVAAAAQEAVERVLLGLVDHALRRTGARDLVLVGGVALNCVANGRLAARCRVLHVPPFAHDAGAALGAALLVARGEGDRLQPTRGADLGTEFTNDDIEAVVRRNRLRFRFVDDPAVEAAGRLEQDQILGWFQGRSEVGPRALGHRSILASPGSTTNQRRVNRVKGREWWRPFAPSMCASETPWIFGRQVNSPYMLQALSLSPAAQTRLPSVAHIDGTTRPQTVAADGGPYSRMLDELGDRIGAKVVLNTSFNGPGEPIVHTPTDAIRTFFTMGLDALLMGNILLDKDN